MRCYTEHVSAGSDPDPAAMASLLRPLAQRTDAAVLKARRDLAAARELTFIRQPPLILLSCFASDFAPYQFVVCEKTVRFV
mmetsp:Transcript_41867/g.98119  ORF Transcript_41867/g.98119 Transcript_41867/m.98119 type:complete len:81 (-) Transcript_41867:43-285(-)